MRNRKWKLTDLKSVDCITLNPPNILQWTLFCCCLWGSMGNQIPRLNINTDDHTADDDIKTDAIAINCRHGKGRMTVGKLLLKAESNDELWLMIQLQFSKTRPLLTFAQPHRLHIMPHPHHAEPIRISSMMAPTINTATTTTTTIAHYVHVRWIISWTPHRYNCNDHWIWW